MTERSIPYSVVWKIYKTSSVYRKQIEDMNLLEDLDSLPWQVQLEVLENAPKEIIKAHVHLLDERAKKRLGLEVRQAKKEWTFKKLW